MVSGGIGGSLLATAYGKAYTSFGGAESLTDVPVSISPVANVSIEYGVTKKSSIGLAFSYTYSTGQLYVYSEAIPDVFEYVSRTTANMQYLRFGKFRKHSVFYYGVRAGVSYWTDKVVDSRTTNPWWPVGGPFEPSLGTGTLVNFNGQIFYGFKIYLAPSVTLDLESGYGTPYWGKAGLSFIF